jgi:hypothetical protein
MMRLLSVIGLISGRNLNPISDLVTAAWLIDFVALLSGLLLRSAHLVPDECADSDQERGSDQKRRSQSR